MPGGRGLSLEWVGGNRVASKQITNRLGEGKKKNEKPLLTASAVPVDLPASKVYFANKRKIGALCMRWNEQRYSIEREKKNKRQ